MRTLLLFDALPHLWVMATTLVYSLQTGKKIQVLKQNVLPQVERAEKKNF